MEEFTPRWFDGCGGGHDDPNGCGDTRGPRMEAMIDEVGSKRLRVEGASSSVCREGRGSAPGATKTSHFVGQWSQVPSAIPVAEGTGRDPTSTVAASEGAIASFEVVSRPRELIPRLEVSGQNHTSREGLTQKAFAGISEQGDGVEVVSATLAEAPVDFAPRAIEYSEALACLDGVSLRDVFDTRAVAPDTNCILIFVSQGVGSSSCCSLVCCCSHFGEETKSRRKRWENDSTCFRRKMVGTVSLE